MPEPITDHAYDSGPVNTGAPCIAWVEESHDGPQACGEFENRHRYSEYVSPGDMHEPKPYTGELDWYDPTEGLAYEHKLK